MLKWSILNKSTGEIWEESARFRIPMSAFQSLKAFVHVGLENLDIDAGDQLQGTILTQDGEVVAETSLMDAAYFPSYSWTNIRTIKPYQA